MTQIIIDDEEDTTKRSVRFADDNSSATNNNGDSVIRQVHSIGHGQIITNNNNEQQQLHLSQSPFTDMNAFNDFMEQSRAEQNSLLDRLESLEATQEVVDTWEDGDSDGGPPPASVQNRGIGEIDDNKNNNSRRSSILRRKTKPWKYQKFPLPESTYTFFITEPILLSMSFVVGFITVLGSLLCLSITLKNELDNAEDGNPYGLPRGVTTEVRIAQFLGIIIGEC